MEEFSLPRSDEPFDFRHQAATYGRYRRDYSSGLYAAIERRAGEGAGRRAVDLGCGTGFVTASLGKRGWDVVGVDFSAPMLAQARQALGSADLIRARGEQLPLREGSIGLLTCGTAFHWLAPADALAEFTRVLAPGGWVALFWRYPKPDEPYHRLIEELLARFGKPIIEGMTSFVVHPPEPFRGSPLVAEPVEVVESELEYSPESFAGYVATVEVVRRRATECHAELIAALRSELEARCPQGFREQYREYLFMARKPG
jgi:SAM-dependent methyltransferase